MKPGARIAVKHEQGHRAGERDVEREAPSPVHGKGHGRNNPQSSALTNMSPLAGSRRGFLKAGSVSLGVLALWFMDALARRTESIPENSETTLQVPWNAAPGTHFYDRMIVVNSQDGVAVFSSTCPHLGCRINCVEGMELVCPCHGSRFTLQGDVAHGPAMQGLRALPFELDRAKNVLRATMGSSAT